MYISNKYSVKKCSRIFEVSTFCIAWRGKNYVALLTDIAIMPIDKTLEKFIKRYVSHWFKCMLLTSEVLHINQLFSINCFHKYYAIVNCVPCTYNLEVYQLCQCHIVLKLYPSLFLNTSSCDPVFLNIRQIYINQNAEKYEYDPRT